MVPGIDKGKTIFRKAVIGLAPSVSAASSISPSMFSITPTKVIIIVGKNKYTEPIIIANSVYNKFSGCSIKPVFNNNVFTTPFFPKMLIQAKLRITELVNNGNKVIAIKKPRHFLETPTIKYAVGMPNTIEIPVTINETLIVRQKIETL